MEFIDKVCPLCGKKFGNKKPKDVTKVGKPYDTLRRTAEFVSPCPSCGENVPVWGESELSGPDPEPAPSEE